MTIQTLSLILLAAVFHATWNILAKSSKHNETLLWLQMIISTIVLTPFVFLFYGLPPAAAWPTLLASGVLQALYYLFLSRCYSIGNLSIVYPFVRGSAPVFVCLFSFLLGFEHLSFPVVIALLLTVSGIYLTNMPQLSFSCISAPIRTLIHDKPTRFSLLTGVMIACYTLVDKQNIKYCDPILVYYIICIIPALLLAPSILKKKEIKAELQQKGWIRACLVSLFTFLAYVLALFAMKYTDATYVSSIREVSVVFVVIFQSIRSHDHNWKPKLVGSIIIFTGIFCMSFFS